MALVDRIRACQRFDPARFRPFVVDGEVLGRVAHGVAARLARQPAVFRVEPGAVRLAPGPSTCEARTRAVAGALAALARRGEAPAPLGEPFPVVARWGEAPRLLLDRSAVPLLGVRAFGVHVNGYLERPAARGGLALWLGRRARTVRTAPGRLDHLVAGGQPHGLTLAQNLAREADQEASIPAEVAATAVAAGALAYRLEGAGGLRDDTLFVFDLRLPPGLRPVNRDGEVEDFALVEPAQALAWLAEPDAFKFNVAPVVLDFLVRHGLLGPEHPEHAAVVGALAELRAAVV